jgi:diamine N-acetyltransferase
MNLRKLKQKDAPFMLEWMHDPFVTRFLWADFASKTIEDCKMFIELSQNSHINIHMAVTDDNDTYMGTASLKNINNDTAEFAIVMRREAMGGGYSKYGMNEIIHIGLDKLKLNLVYWFVLPENKRAVKFYDKNGYKRVENIMDCDSMITVFNRKEYQEIKTRNYIWYIVK